MNSIIETLNRWGEGVGSFAWLMLWQSSLLIAVLFVLDFALQQKVRAAIRYALWLVVLVKLLLPPSLALPTGVGWWLRSPAPPPAIPQTRTLVVTYGNAVVPNLPLPRTPQVFVPPPPPPMSAAAWTLVACGCISVGLLAWLLIRWGQVAKKVRRAVTPEKLAAVSDQARCLAGLRSGIQLKLTDGAMSPAVCGLFRPVILLPRSLVEKLSPAQLRAVLLHELIHLRRGDVWVNCAQALLQIAYWWHPLLWLANARIRRVREEAVDDAVMLALAGDAETYAPTLLEVAKLAFNRPLVSLGLVGILESRSALRQRIERLVNFRPPRKAGLTLVSLFGILAFTALAVPMGEAPQKEIAPQESKAAPPPHPPSRSETNAEPAKAGGFNPGPTKLTLEKPVIASDWSPGYKIVLSVIEIEVREDGSYQLGPAKADLDELKSRLSEAKQANSNLTARLRVDAKTPFRPIVPLMDLCKELGIKVTAEFGSTNVRPTQAIISKLNRIYLNNVQYDNLPLSEVIRNLSEDVKNHDLEKKGVNFTINPAAPPGETTDVNSVSVKINPALWNIRLADVLDIIVKVADKPIKYSIDDNGIIFSLGALDPLYMRTFRYDPDKFYERLAVPRELYFDQAKGVRFTTTNSFAQFCAALRKLIFDSGVYLQPPKNLFITDRNASVLVRATLPELDRLESVIRELDVSPSVTNAVTNASGMGIDLPATGIYSDSQFREVLRALDQLDEPGVHEPTAPAPVSGSDTNLSMRGEGRQAIVSKLNRTYLRSVQYDNLPLSEVIRNLSEDVKNHDPDKAGINFILNPEAPPGGAADIRSIAIKIDPALTDVRLADLLDIIVKAAGRPIKYSITDQGIIFSREAPDAEPLYMRAFKVDPNTFYQGLESVAALDPGTISKLITRTNPPGLRSASYQMETVSGAVRSFFTSLGVNLATPGKSVFWNDRKGELLVRATKQDLDIIEKAIEVLNIAPPQVNIKVKFIEVPEEIASAFWKGREAGTNVSAILTPDQTRAVLQELQSQPATDLLDQADVTTVTGRQAHFEISDLKTIVTSINPKALKQPGISTNEPTYLTEALPFGPVLDIIPYVSADGYTIQVTLIAKVTEFLGYDKPTNSPTVFIDGKRVSNATPVYVDGRKRWEVTPLPHYRLRQITNIPILVDGDTVVLGKPVHENGQPDENPGDGKKRLLVFVTPTIVDSAGNRVHTDEEISALNRK